MPRGPESLVSPLALWSANSSDFNPVNSQIREKLMLIEMCNHFYILFADVTSGYAKSLCIKLRCSIFHSSISVHYFRYRLKLRRGSNSKNLQSALITEHHQLVLIQKDQIKVAERSYTILNDVWFDMIHKCSEAPSPYGRVSSLTGIWRCQLEPGEL